MARRSLSVKVMERQTRALRILEGVFRVSDPIIGELVMQAIEELKGISDLCITPSVPVPAKRRSVPPTETPLGVAFGADALAKATARSRKAKATP
jgi:hypothetical protein